MRNLFYPRHWASFLIMLSLTMPLQGCLGSFWAKVGLTICRHHPTNRKWQHLYHARQKCQYLSARQHWALLNFRMGADSAGLSISQRKNHSFH